MFQSTAAGLIGLTGASALLHVDKEPRLEQEPAQILPLLTVELTVRDQALRLRIVTNKTVQSMVDGVSLESGTSALQYVEEEPRLEPEPALVLLLLTVELIVQVLGAKNRAVTLTLAQVTRMQGYI